MILLYKIIATIIACMHLGILGLNVIAIPCLVYFQPFYIWMPIITLMISPLLSGTYCMFNRIENHFRIKAGLKPIEDRLSHLLGKE